MVYWSWCHFCSICIHRKLLGLLLELLPPIWIVSNYLWKFQSCIVFKETTTLKLVWKETRKMFNFYENYKTTYWSCSSFQCSFTGNARKKVIIYTLHTQNCFFLTTLYLNINVDLPTYYVLKLRDKLNIDTVPVCIVSFFEKNCQCYISSRKQIRNSTLGWNGLMFITKFCDKFLKSNR